MLQSLLGHPGNASPKSASAFQAQEEKMIQTALSIVTVLSLFGMNPPLQSGVASQYAQGVMPLVVRNRQALGQLPSVLPKVDGFIAVVL